MRPGAGRLVVAATAIVAVFGLTAPALASPAQNTNRSHAWLDGRGHYTHRGSHGEVDVNVCSADQAPGFARCASHIRTDVLDDNAASPASFAPGPPGDVSAGTLGNRGAYDPPYLQSAYNAPSSSKGVGQTVAVVDAYDAPLVAADLTVYRTRFGLPACTVASGCFTKVNQTGGLTPPAANTTWAQETTLDVEMVSALCPNCKILLVEASSNSLTDLGKAVDQAVAMGADVVSNSYGANEFSTESFADHYYNHPGVAIVASSGDDGYGVNYPAASPYVVAVGGTTLRQSTSNGTRNATETVWSGAGSGCSAYEPKPAWQSDTGCARRTVTDVSAVADPNTGVWVYNSADGGWQVFGGTSVAAPIVSALYALAGNAPSTVTMSQVPYTAPAAFNDVVSGSNGSCGSYLCTGVAGYDGPTGLGTANTVAGFTIGGSLFRPLTPGYSLAASGLRSSMRAGRAAKSTVTVTPRYGFSGNVALSATAKPRGLTVSRRPGTVAVNGKAVRSQLTLSAKKGGRYVVTITARHGAVVRTTALRVVVNDFEMKVSPARSTVVRGNRVQYRLELKARGGFNKHVNLKVTGLPARDTVMYAHDPAGASSSQVITIVTSPDDAVGTIAVRFTAVSGALRHHVTVRLTRE